MQYKKCIRNYLPFSFKFFQIHFPAIFWQLFHFLQLKKFFSEFLQFSRNFQKLWFFEKILFKFFEYFPNSSIQRHLCYKSKNFWHQKPSVISVYSNRTLINQLPWSDTYILGRRLFVCRKRTAPNRLWSAPTANTHQI
jgi:hypothetical protein